MPCVANARCVLQGIAPQQSRSLPVISCNICKLIIQKSTKSIRKKKANQEPKQLKETRKRSLHRQRFVSQLNIVCFFSFVGDILFYYYSKYSYDISDRLVTSALKDSHLSAIGTSANILHRCNSTYCPCQHILFFTQDTKLNYLILQSKPARLEWSAFAGYFPKAQWQSL